MPNIYNAELNLIPKWNNAEYMTNAEYMYNAEYEQNND